MNCTSCGAPMKLKADLQSLKCEYCHSVYFPEKNDDGVRVLEEQSSHDCPICSVPLMHAYLFKSPIIYCRKCNGMLIAMGMLEPMIDQLRSTHAAATTPPPTDKDDLRRKINCPQCHRPLDAHIYGGPGNVVIDSCETCSLLWLDRSELMRIARAPDSSPTAQLSHSEGSDPQPGDIWVDLGESVAGGMIFDDIADSFFK
jgi:Zn-finger nucleic acid-binding protein